MKIQNLMERAKAITPGASLKRSASNEDVMWYVIESRLLEGEKILLVTKKKYLKQARREHPDKVIYFPPEIQELYKHKDQKEFIKKVHLAKKEFKGWIVPSKNEQGGVRNGKA